MLHSQTFTDQELLTLLKTNEQLALKHIYNRYWKRLYLSAYSIIRDDAQCEDIVQDVLLQMWVRKNDVAIDSLKSYLFTAVRYKVLSYIKSASNKKVFLEPGELEKLAGMQIPHDRLQESDINDLLELGLANLPERCRQVFVLSRKKHLSNKEIAEQMGISVKTVENQMTIALKQLRLVMGDYLFWTCVVLPIFRD